MDHRQAVNGVINYDPYHDERENRWTLVH